MPKKLHNALTAVSVRNAKPGIGKDGKEYAKRYADGGGLYLQVKPGGARSWVWKGTAAGKVKVVGLGSAGGAGALSLADAREIARDKSKEAAAGIVPMSDRKRLQGEAKAAAQTAKIAGTTFKDAAESFLAMNEDGWKNDKHRAQWRSTLNTYVYGHFGDLPVCEVQTEHVLAALKPIWREKPETANRVRGRIERVLDAAKVEGLREGENPARWRGHLQNVLIAPTQAIKRRNERLGREEHHRALPYAELPALIAKTQGVDGIAALALEFTILTAARTGETIGATWREVDVDAALWTIPAQRMKAGLEHTIPLSSRAIEILRFVLPLAEARGEIADCPLFPSHHGRALSNMAMLMQLRRLAPVPKDEQNFTVHGFRSSFRDWASETTAYSQEVCEMALSHTIGNKAEAAYRRGNLLPKRRKLMEAWADYCAGVGIAAGDVENVTPIRAAS